MIRTIAYATLGVLAIYVLGAFVAWDFNAANWLVEGRVIAAFLGFLAGVSSGMMSVFR